MSVMIQIGKIAAMVLGIVLVLDGCVSMVLFNWNVGFLATMLMGALMIFLVTPGSAHLPTWLSAVLWVCIALAVLFASALTIYGTVDTVTYQEDAVIVLGAGLNGDEPSGTLARRLNKAAAYHTKNPDALIVLSGGQGPQEEVSEAAAMEKYLLDRGVDAACLVKEDRSTSTYENMVFSKELLDARFDRPYTVAYVSNEYHIYRAGRLAAIAGFDNTTHIHSNTYLGQRVPGCLRECMAVVKLWLFRQ